MGKPSYPCFLNSRIWSCHLKKVFLENTPVLIIHSLIRLSMLIMTNLSSIKIVAYPKNELAESIYYSWRFPEEAEAAARTASAAWTVRCLAWCKAMGPPLVSPWSKKQMLVGNWWQLLMAAMVVLWQNQNQNWQIGRILKTTHLQESNMRKKTAIHTVFCVLCSSNYLDFLNISVKTYLQLNH